MSRAMVPDLCLVLKCLDRSGASVSTCCAIHCALMPALVALLPALGLGFLASEGTETTLLVASIALGLASLAVGYRVHRSARVVAALGVGFALLIGGRCVEGGAFERFGTALMVTGGLLIAAAHLISRRLGRVPSRAA